MADRVAVRDDVERAYESMRDDLYYYTMYMGIPASQAQELCQEAFLRLHTTMLRGESIQNVRAWLFRVAHNLALKARAREGGFLEFDPDTHSAAAPRSQNPEQSLLEKERSARLSAALRHLSPQQRNCLHLRSEGLRYREIAAVVGISSSAVNEFLRRALVKLKEALHE